MSNFLISNFKYRDTLDNFLATNMLLTMYCLPHCLSQCHPSEYGHFNNTVCGGMSL